MHQLSHQPRQDKNESAIRACKNTQPSQTIVHAKLEMTNPSDHDELEADTMADTVVNGGTIRREISNGSSGGGVAVSAAMESQLAQAKGGGRAMPDGLRNMMESGFGRDFSNVRIHTDSQAEAMNNSLSAKAFTLGNDIYFNKGQFSPNTREGQHLMVHELTHVVQGSGKVGRKRKSVDEEMEYLEREYFSHFDHISNYPEVLQQQNGNAETDVKFDIKRKYLQNEDGNYLIDCEVFGKEAIRYLEGDQTNLEIAESIKKWSGETELNGEKYKYSEMSFPDHSALLIQYKDRLWLNDNDSVFEISFNKEEEGESIIRRCIEKVIECHSVGGYHCNIDPGRGRVVFRGVLYEYELEREREVDVDRGLKTGIKSIEKKNEKIKPKKIKRK